MKSKNEIHREIIQSAMKDAKATKGMHPAGRILLAIGLILLIILIVIPYYSIKTAPHPRNIPTLAELSVPVPKVTDKEVLTSESSLTSFMDPSDPDVKRISATIASKSCLFGKVCHAKAIFYFVRDNIKYISDPPKEYIEAPLETLSAGGADCDGMAVVLASMLEAVGIKTRFVFIQNHVYVQAKLPDASMRYRDSDDWVSLDATCKTCDFGIIPYIDAMSEKRYSG